jgi:hypothetical protein
LAVVETQEQGKMRALIPSSLDDDDDRNPNETRKNLASNNNSTRDVDEEDCGVEVVLGATVEDTPKDGDNSDDDDDDDESDDEDEDDDESYDDVDSDGGTADDVSHCLASSSHASMGVVVYCPSDESVAL